MLRQPRRTRFNKFHKGNLPKTLVKSPRTTQGQLGLQTLYPCYIPGNQIEAARQTIRRHLQRKGRLIINIFPDRGISNKPREVRIGKGKGKCAHWVCAVKAGQIIFEVEGVNEKQGRRALQLGGRKLSCSIRLIQNSL